MKSARAEFLDEFDPRQMHGTLDFGANATGVIQSRLHFTGDEIIAEDVMSGAGVQTILDSVAELRANMRKRPKGGVVGGKIPLPLYATWRRVWEATAKKDGMLWRAFLTSKLMDADNSRLRTMNL